MIVYDNPIRLSDGRSYYVPDEDLPISLCDECHGAGCLDSCFDCGNRGYFVPNRKLFFIHLRVIFHKLGRKDGECSVKSS